MLLSAQVTQRPLKDFHMKTGKKTPKRNRVRLGWMCPFAPSGFSTPLEGLGGGVVVGEGGGHGLIQEVPL